MSPTSKQIDDLRAYADERKGELAKLASREYAHGYSDALKDTSQRWTPCQERPPEANGRYFVTRGLKACNSIWNRVYIINFSDFMGLIPEKIWWEGNVGKSDFREIDDVLAWMPLPEPWREEGDY